jgi:hypothetical protein
MNSPRRIFISLTALLALILTFCAVALAASHFAVGTFTGPTSQVGAFGYQGKQGHGKVTINSGYPPSSTQRAVNVDPVFETRCTPHPSATGFYSNALIPRIFDVNPSGQFHGKFHYDIHTSDNTTGYPVVGHIGGSLSGTYRSPWLITGRVQLTVNVFERGRKMDTCTASFSYSAKRPKH